MLQEILYFYTGSNEVKLESIPKIIDMYSDSLVLYDHYKMLNYHIKESTGKTYLYR